jgi:2-polyprenyl-3-methyl-5-hydroxy-6-metoxy-1,4-benzoquinol methylase
MTAYLWEKLSNNERADYSEIERIDIREQFVHEPKRLLDIGCARGHVSAAIKRDFESCKFTWGVDLDLHSISVAKERLDKTTEHSVENFTPDEIALLKTIDTILLLDVLEHMYDPWRVLRFLASHVSEDTQLIISLPNVMNIYQIQDTVEGYWQYSRHGLLDITHIRFFTPYEMKKMFYETGFRLEKEDYVVRVQNEAMEKCEQANIYPCWVTLNQMQIHVQNKEHWLALNSIQVYSRLRIAADEDLRPDEQIWRFGEHSLTQTYKG